MTSKQTMIKVEKSIKKKTSFQVYQKAMLKKINAVQKLPADHPDRIKFAAEAKEILSYING